MKHYFFPLNIIYVFSLSHPNISMHILDIVHTQSHSADKVNLFNSQEVV